MTDLLKNPIFKDETKAREWLEARVWPNGPVCPHCGNVDQGQDQGARGQGPPSGPLPVRRVPRTIHRDRQNRIRAQQNSSDQVAGRPVPDDGLQEGR